MTASRPAFAPLVGTFIRLDPMLKSDIPALFSAIGHPEIFAGGYGGGPAGYRDTLDGFTEFAESYYSWDSGNVYAVRLIGGEHDGLLVGTTTLGDIDVPNEAGHIGWTAYDPRVWGTAVNPEAKLLLLGSAFDAGLGRVKIQADALNERSRAAILKLGAQFEGIFRRDRPRADGTWRDSAVFSIIVDEWPIVRNGLESRLAAFGAEPVALRTRQADGTR
ncbi:RimJ/RimL family protein N-acetyltransferase [Conyzicola lurida]|uniref:RimJ/RimL family protein N-acetyltransferase n=1 Tax=Conyzicola lurida TaxID=1172621 RepID=A0A841AM24_9MICO|nr:GNAT family protein [Conyzicola lurida]MBB5845060.1 RimJ/RimL family protein N-acetyltransferase [Conyzicola lurida]